jgi:hypothetical protein
VQAIGKARLGSEPAADAAEMMAKAVNMETAKAVRAAKLRRGTSATCVCF